MGMRRAGDRERTTGASRNGVESVSVRSYKYMKCYAILCHAHNLPRPPQPPHRRRADMDTVCGIGPELLREAGGGGVPGWIEVVLVETVDTPNAVMT